MGKSFLSSMSLILLRRRSLVFGPPPVANIIASSSVEVLTGFESTLSIASSRRSGSLSKVLEAPVTMMIRGGCLRSSLSLI